MTAHWENVHYVQRPAKNIERKMIAEVLGILGSYVKLGRFQYVGFGSIYFVDFALFHRRLGISRMTSIEMESSSEAQKRVSFNRPFRFVKVQFGHSNDVLPTHDWRAPCIVWLDYNGRMGDEVFADVSTVVAKATPPFVLLVTVNVEAQQSVGRFRRFSEAVGAQRVPPGFNSDNDLADAGTAAAVRQVFDDEFNRRVHVRNALAEPSDYLSYVQVFHFRYRDRAPMLTVGGVCLPTADRTRLDESGIFDSPYAKAGDVPYEITVPNLTVREMLYLDQKMAQTGIPNFSRIGLSTIEAEEYRKAYKYFPAFVDIESL